MDFKVNVWAENPTPGPVPPQGVNTINIPSEAVTNLQTSVAVGNINLVPVNVYGGITAKSKRMFIGFSIAKFQVDAGYPILNQQCRGG